MLWEQIGLCTYINAQGWMKHEKPAGDWFNVCWKLCCETIVDKAIFVQTTIDVHKVRP
jgi:hypothetical protein